MRTKNADEKLGLDILRSALEAPFRQLAANAGEEPSQVLRRVRASNKPTHGFDFEKKIECDMVKEGIVDAARVARLALRNASSVAGMLFSTDCVVTSIASDDHDHHDHPELQDMGY